jgi:sporulation protein YlmC with PRC-barrel domain
MEKITALLMTEIETEDGTRLGRLYDLRCSGEPEHGLAAKDRPITELVYGTTGLWEVLGLKEPNVRTIPWRSVRSIERGRIIVASTRQSDSSS